MESPFKADHFRYVPNESDVMMTPTILNQLSEFRSQKIASRARIELISVKYDAKLGSMGSASFPAMRGSM
ncbi:MAG: hypothetical protein A3F83_01350 [Candidatus Glassbacteria bacterium RIFCSPLOWO2_12_FULL_58_11]|uniref:Uncharacterized protein n=1 Tax=Candidatus Glassbacteria bacterium RIFCSPLOWO2_12_FULL_58_11 TaxID=1817867 RepID=A0A1F5YLT9_9BACT|nr:MAG: hypothetical protein A3F83_01350 [Candidatus Glassbacteria bacterium RIFCSPLOWO2_12_FULL_58_11]